MSRHIVLAASLCMASLPLPLTAGGMTVTVLGEDGAPVPLVMVTVKPADRSLFADKVMPERSVFTANDGVGVVAVPDQGKISLRLRKPGFADTVTEVAANASPRLTLAKQTSAITLVEERPANAWLAAMNFGDAELQQHFRLQCGFCHQQGTPNTRADRTPEEWEKIFDRMIRYGSRLMSPAQKKLPELLQAEHRRLAADPGLIPPVKPWEGHLARAEIVEWALGDGSSQLHDVFLASSGKLYAGDNLQDNLIELDPTTNISVSHKIPKRPDDKLGGNIGGRLKNYPGVGTYVGLHSLDESPTDGHLFLTGSDSSRLVEFDPQSGEFVLYDLPDGYYPHTVRIDQKDRVWFTMAVSNQVAMFDRSTKTFTFHDLPARTWKEKATIFLLPVVLKLANWGVPMHRMPIDSKSDGLPLPYGIDISPDGTVWFSRLHSDELGRIEPDNNKLTMFPTPFKSPRRLRTDAEGNVWITVFAEGKLAKFDPRTERFTLFDLPTQPAGSDTPYSLNVDRKRAAVWVNGTASDTMMRFDIKSESWRVYPLPRRRTFTRDVVIAEDGSIYTSNGSFPAWHIEDGQPTVIRVIPGAGS